MAEQGVGALDWAGLVWSPWIRFDASAGLFKGLPAELGLYRTRVVGQQSSSSSSSLAYIGQTGRSLRERALARQTLAHEMPFNDPHTAAPGHWAYRVHDRADFELSVAIFEGVEAQRLGYEDCLLWLHRVSTGCSTLNNYGRFHPHYTRPRNRSTGVRGRQLPDDQINPASGPCSRPLRLQGDFCSLDWMGLRWFDFTSLDGASRLVPSAAGVYRIIDNHNRSLLYIGESEDVAVRLATHHKSGKFNRLNAHVSVCVEGEFLHSWHRHELESDLLGSYFFQHRTAPALQYGQQPEH